MVGIRTNSRIRAFEQADESNLSLTQLIFTIWVKSIELYEACRHSFFYASILASPSATVYHTSVRRRIDSLADAESFMEQLHEHVVTTPLYNRITYRRCLLIS